MRIHEIFRAPESGYVGSLNLFLMTKVLSSCNIYPLFYILRILLLLLFGCGLSFNSNAQNIKYNLSSSKDGYFGKIKSISAYAMELDFIDSVGIDSSITNKGKIQFVKFYNEKGLLIKSENYNKKDNCWIKHYKYSDHDNIDSIITIQIGTEYFQEEVFDYTHEKLQITQTTNEAQNIRIGREIMHIYKKRLKFDEKNRLIQTEYLSYFT